VVINILEEPATTFFMVDVKEMGAGHVGKELGEKRKNQVEEK
jgi:hypothetical protein